MKFEVNNGGRYQGELRVPGDKSISHRSVMLGALAEGTTRVKGLLEGDDVKATIAAFRAMGVSMEGPDEGKLVVHGAGMHGLRAPDKPLDMGNSGTAMRLMAGILAGQGFDSTLTGDASLSARPMNRIADPLRLMGAVIETSEGGRPPLVIRGGHALHGIDYVLPMASAQVKSAILLAGMYAGGNTSVTEPAPTRDHTERMLSGFGYDVQVQGSRIELEGGGRLKSCDVDVPADISSAAFFLVGASIAPGSDLVLQHVGMNPTRVGVIEILRLMGADITVSNPREVGGEPVADLRVRASRLRGINIPVELVPLAIDEFPVLFIAAANADGTTVLSGAEELRVKESDRIAVMARGLESLGVSLEEKPDGIVIQGGSYGGGRIHSHDDHRIAMAFATAALTATAPIHIDECDNVATSFPNFVALAREAGLQIEVGQG